MCRPAQPQYEPSWTYSFPLLTYAAVWQTGFGLDPRFPTSVNITLYFRLAQPIPTSWFPSIPSLLGPPLVTGFCIHLHGDIPFPISHSPYSIQHTERPPCVPCGNHPNRLVYQLYGVVWRYLRSHALFSEANFREAISRSLNVLVENCIVCNSKIAIGYTLLRSTTCSRPCSRQLRKSHLLVRFPELIKDFEAVKLHFFAVVGAIQTSKLYVPRRSLLRMSETEMIYHARCVWERFLQPINAANPIESWIANLEPRTELFMSWVLTSYRGVLITIPRWLHPNVDCEILFASANPQAEAAFAKRLFLTGGKSQLVFHGTTTDRLQSILHIGLQTQTNPNMKRWGNALGNGIYTTDNSEVALRYAQPQPEDADYSRSVLLICELARPAKHKKSNIDPRSKQACRIFVTVEPDDLILRVVIHTNPGVKLPLLPWNEAQRLIRLAKQ